MKLVAKKDFANVPSLGLKLSEKTDGFVHENHVHKGHRFSVGSADIFDDLKPADKVIVAQLIRSQSAVIDNDMNKPLVAKIDDEVKAEAKREASLPEPMSLADQIAAGVAAAIAAMQPKKA